VNAVVKYAGRPVTFCDPDPVDWVEGQLLRGQWFESANLEFIRGLQVSGNYVDAGAFVGTHAIFFSLFCPASRIYAFEPQPVSYAKLARNIEVNGIANCQIFNTALSDSPGRGSLRQVYWIEMVNRGGAELLPGDEVQVATLDSFCLPPISLMKVDVEGLELRVLHGARETLHDVEHLFVEMWPESRCLERGLDYTIPKVTEFLARYGLHLRRELPTDCLFYFSRESGGSA
jgi:FkbM family methyltransferase